MPGYVAEGLLTFRILQEFFLEVRLIAARPSFGSFKLERLCALETAVDDSTSHADRGAGGESSRGPG